MGSVFQLPGHQQRDPAFRRRIENSFSTKRRNTLESARHLLACLIRLSDTPAYADAGRLLPACQSVVDELSELDPTKPSAQRKLARIASILEDISRQVAACTQRQAETCGQQAPERHDVASRS